MSGLAWWLARREGGEVEMECELPSFYITSELVARKSHRCCECSSLILPGEKYLLCSGRWDNQISRYRQHLICAEACMLIRDSFNDHECIPFGGLMEFWDEMRPLPRGPRWAADDSTRKLRGLMAQILRLRRRRRGINT